MNIVACLVCLDELPSDVFTSPSPCRDEARHTTCLDCLKSLIVSSIRSSPPQLPIRCPGRCSGASVQRCHTVLDDSLVRTVLSFDNDLLIQEYEQASLVAAFVRILPQQVILWTPCCKHPFEIDRRDCAVVARVLPCPYKCRASMCTGCTRQLTLTEQQHVQSVQMKDTTSEKPATEPTQMNQDVPVRSTGAATMSVYEGVVVVPPSMAPRSLSDSVALRLFGRTTRQSVPASVSSSTTATESPAMSVSSSSAHANVPDNRPVPIRTLSDTPGRAELSFETDTDTTMDDAAMPGVIDSDMSLPIAATANASISSASPLSDIMNLGSSSSISAPFASLPAHPELETSFSRPTASYEHTYESIWRGETADAGAISWLGRISQPVAYALREIRSQPILASEFESMISGESMVLPRRNLRHSWDVQELVIDTAMPDWNNRHTRKLHDHLGPLCFRPELHEPDVDDFASPSSSSSSSEASWTDEQLHRMFRRTLDEWAPHCPVCRRLGLKSGLDCNVITCECGTEWCFMCSKEMHHNVADYLHARRTKPALTAFMLISRRHEISTVFEHPTVTDGRSSILSSSNHHSNFNCVPISHRHDPHMPGKPETLCPSTLEQLAITYQLPEFVQVRDAYYAESRPLSYEMSSFGQMSFSDGIEYRLLQPFLRLRAVCGFRVLQAAVSDVTFLRGLRMFPEWAHDSLLCDKLNVAPL